MSARADKRNRRILSGLVPSRAQELLSLKAAIRNGAFEVDSRLEEVAERLLEDAGRLPEPPRRR